MSTAEKVWNRDFANVDKIITNAGAVVTADDGFQWIDESKVGAGTVRLYSKLVSVGYAKGWL